MREWIHRTIRHDDGSKIQVRKPIGMHPASVVSSRVEYLGVFLGCVYHRPGMVEVHPVFGSYIQDVPSVAEGARILVRMNGGMPRQRWGQ